MTSDKEIEKAHIRKFSPIDRETPIYEVLSDDEILFDVSIGDDGQPELAFHPAIGKKRIRLSYFHKVVEECLKLIRSELIENMK